MWVSESGRVSEVSLVHSQKALYPMWVSESGRVIARSAMHPPKA